MIDKIDGLGSVRSTQSVKRPAAKSGASGAGFSKHLDETGEARETGGVSGAGAITGILGIQEVDDALAHASKGKARARDILDRLEDMRLELLAGGISKEKLMQLSRVVNAQRGQIKDPKLTAILDEIDLRAQVELAKHAQNEANG